MIDRRDNELSAEGMCELLDVSASGYYAWRGREIPDTKQDEIRLVERIEIIFHASRDTYGSDRVHRALKREGIHTSRKRVARLMREHGLRSVRARKRRIGLTKSLKNSFIAPNLLEQDFTTTHRHEKWVTDTTYIPTREGWLYLVSVLDLHTRQVVGWAMGDHHDAQLATSALTMALHRQHPKAGLILHSDRGSEFANACFHKQAQVAGIRLSMSGAGNCYDNAVAESFFATVKLEAVAGRVFVSKQEARRHLFDYIEVFYNRQRLHSSIGFHYPVECVA